jgi:SAM-dependent methyltransferase
MSKKVVYVGKDLEAMSFAVNYHKWILDEFRPFFGKKFVEVGAGTGSFSELLLQEKPEKLDIIEPSEMFEFLEQNVSQIETATKISFHQAIFADVRREIGNGSKPDSIIYVNVLEHIEDDKGELAMIYETLESGGKCFIFVPALQSLYGEFDRKIGHFRRYTKSEIEEKCKAAGFRVLKSKYFDFTGIFPWWIKYKLLKSDTLESGAVTLYDKIAIPVISRFEKILPMPIGKNILLIVEK